MSRHNFRVQQMYKDTVKYFGHLGSNFTTGKYVYKATIAQNLIHTFSLTLSESCRPFHFDLVKSKFSSSPTRILNAGRLHLYSGKVWHL